MQSVFQTAYTTAPTHGTDTSNAARPRGSVDPNGALLDPRDWESRGAIRDLARDGGNLDPRARLRRCGNGVDNTLNLKGGRKIGIGRRVAADRPD